MCGFEENVPKPDFEQKWPNFGPKKGPKMAQIFMSGQKISLTISKQ